MYRIIRVKRYFKYGARVTSETTIRVDATLEDVLALVKKQGEDIDAVLAELEEYGITCFRGYMVDKI